MIENLIEISKDELLGEVQKAKYEGYRFVTASCADTGTGIIDVTYHFDKDLALRNYRIKVGKEDEISSISGIYFCAVLVENEMKELFGLNIANIAIDYGGHMLLADVDFNAPLTRSQIVIEQRGGK
ncbi:MAG: NADH-quinone oxidoreductase subunit C [Clostridiales bacterium]|nr:NADH-quinone oxidoreductase subunit C [Eubacteriales bacterium]MDH7567545.1 NADH-quinone oxidoreductase subunit C [Clostridiales bacterium]